MIKHPQTSIHDNESEAHEALRQENIKLNERIAELKAENKIFRSTESVDDSVWDALLEQVRQFQAKLGAVKNCISRNINEVMRESCSDDECVWMHKDDVLKAIGEQEHGDG